MSDPLPPTEHPNPDSKDLDLLSPSALVGLVVADQGGAVEAVLAQTEPIAQAVEVIAQRLGSGGTLHYVGAGTSGRVAMLDAVEMPPTFGTPAGLVRAHLAGDTAALTQSVEGAEDDERAGDTIARENVRAADAVVGISASGGAAFVVAAVRRARKIGAYTVAVTSVAGSPLALAVEQPIVVATGSEVLTGSTRLKAATAQKIVLNAVSTAVMVRLGKAYGNLMVDVVGSNRKLRARAGRLVAEIAEVDEARARQLLDEADWRVKAAIVMQRRGVDCRQAQTMLDDHHGSLRDLL